MADLSASEERALAAIDRPAIVSSLVELARRPEHHRQRRRVRAAAPWPALQRPASRSTCGRSTSRTCARTPTSRAPRPRGSRATALVGTHGRQTACRRWCCRGTWTSCPRATWPSGGRRPVRSPPSGRRSDLHGRGACDMKAGLAANLAVVRAIAPPGVAAGGRLAVHCVVSEEDGGLGAFATLRRGHTGDAASSPSRPADAGHRERRRADLPPRGRRPGRPREHPAGGSSAVEAFWPVHRALRPLEARATPIRRPAVRRLPAAVRASRSARCRPATGPARCPTCWSPRAGWACGWTRTRPRPGPSSRRRRRGCADADAVAARPPARGDLARRAVRQRAGCPTGTRLVDGWPGRTPT